MDLSEKEQVSGKKVAGIMVVVTLHALLAYALLTGLGRVAIKIAAEEIPIVFEAPVEPALKEPVVEPPKPKTMAPPQVEVPIPDVAVSESPMPTNPVTPTDVPDTGSPLGSESGTGSGPAVVSAVVDFGSCQKPEYPASSLRNQEEGISRLMFLIDTNGKISEARVQKTSGFRSLDSAAIRALSLCKFTPGTIDGQPQKTWASVDYAWKLVQ